MNSRDLPKNPLQRLEAVPNVRLILLLGPPGCGKSALLRRWVSARQRATAALVSLTAHDDSPAAFTQRLIRSLDGSAKLGAEARSQGLANLNLEGQSALLLSILEGAPAGFALVLDDCHQISHPEVWEILRVMLDYLPAHVYLVIASRSEPPVQVARLRVRRELVEIEIQC